MALYRKAAIDLDNLIMALQFAYYLLIMMAIWQVGVDRIVCALLDGNSSTACARIALNVFD